jgi:hypothetical protein
LAVDIGLTIDLPDLVVDGLALAKRRVHRTARTIDRFSRFLRPQRAVDPPEGAMRCQYLRRPRRRSSGR